MPGNPLTLRPSPITGGPPPMYRAYKAPLTRRLRRRMRRRIHRVRPYQWLQYFGLLMLMVGAGILVGLALNL
ncbi:hypothetical protein AC792_03965 [Arthrobacter sp. RIT-PI-e]|nr:hypothetical protein AC792_03965 [Arthrobacter sp. RIT-PI-e]